MTKLSVQPLRGCDDRYPEDMAVLNYIFDTAQSVAALYGFAQYDAPIIEPMSLYENKSSAEILNEQAFTLTDRNGLKLLLRPEMTPSLARIVAKKAQSLIYPIRLFNIGLRYRYEAPQKGRNREFYQMDYDIIGSDSELADIEILSLVVRLLNAFGATEKDFVLYINSRAAMSTMLEGFGIPVNTQKNVLSVIDRRDKVDEKDFRTMLMTCELSQEQCARVEDLLSNPSGYAEQFEGVLSAAEACGIRQYIEVNPAITRGLDYYTGLVFEAKSKGSLKRSIFGGGRYDNLVGMFDVPQQSGTGFAVSDTALLAFLDDAGILPTITPQPTQVLMTVFDDSTQTAAIAAAARIRNAGISCELYPGLGNLQRQLKYANKKGIPYVAIIGPDEFRNSVIQLRNMSEGSQETYTLDTLIKQLT